MLNDLVPQHVVSIESSVLLKYRRFFVCLCVFFFFFCFFFLFFFCDLFVSQCDLFVSQ